MRPLKPTVAAFAIPRRLVVTVSEVSWSRRHPPTTPGRWELLRAVRSMTVIAPPASDHIARSLSIPPFGAADYTATRPLAAPYAGIHLGPEGKLGDEGADRAAGMWRALASPHLQNADHLGSLFILYSELGDAADQTAVEQTRQRLEQTRGALLWEHLWSSMPGYLDVVFEDSDRRDDSGAGGLRLWAEFRRALVRETELTPGAADLPLALRAAPT